MSRVNIDSTLLGVGTRGGGNLGEYGQEKKRQQGGVLKEWEVVGSGRNRGKTHITILNILQSKKG